MAEGAGGGAEYRGHMTPFMVLSCVVAGSGGILFGYDLGISGGVTSMDSFLKRFFPEACRQKQDSKVSNYCHFDSDLLTLFTSSLYIAGLVASLIASSVTRKYGRRMSMLIGSVVFIVGSIFGGAAVNVPMLLINRILLGIGLGFTNQSIPLYLSEIAPPKYRGAINNSFALSISLGILFATILNYFVAKTTTGWAWRISLSVAAVPAAFLTIGAIFLPETPSFIIQCNGDINKARIVLQKLRGTTSVQEELDNLISASKISRTSKYQVRSIFKRKYWPQLVIALLIPFFSQVTGINAMNFYAPVMFRSTGLKETASLLSAVVTRLCATFANIMAILMVDRLGRRKLFFLGGFQMFLSHLTMGAILATKFRDQGYMDKEYAYLVLIAMCVFIAGYGWSWGALTSLVPVEVCPLEIRSAGQSIVVAVTFLMQFAIGQTFLAVLCCIKSATFILFGGWIFLMTLFVFLFLPETKKLPLEQMDQIWRKHWFWKLVVGVEEKEHDGENSSAELLVH